VVYFITLGSWCLRFLQYIQRARSYCQRNFRYVRHNAIRALLIKPTALGFAVEFQQELHQYVLEATHIPVLHSKCTLELTFWRIPIFLEVPYRPIPMCLRRNTHILIEHKSQTFVKHTAFFGSYLFLLTRDILNESVFSQMFCKFRHLYEYCSIANSNKWLILLIGIYQF